MHQTFKIRSRGIIVHEGKLLVVKHRPESNYYALPGGHLEGGEDVTKCLEREIIEELGMKPVIGRLLYVHTFKDKDDVHSVEFFFEVTNGEAFVKLDEHTRTHAHEVAEIRWVTPSEKLKILPQKVTEDFSNNTLLSNQTRFTTG